MNVVLTSEESGCPICFPSVCITACYSSTVTRCVLVNLLSTEELLVQKLNNASNLNQFDTTDKFTTNHCRTPQSIFYDNISLLFLKMSIHILLFYYSYIRVAREIVDRLIQAAIK